MRLVCLDIRATLDMLVLMDTQVITDSQVFLVFLARRANVVTRDILDALECPAHLVRVDWLVTPDFPDFLAVMLLAPLVAQARPVSPVAMEILACQESPVSVEMMASLVLLVSLACTETLASLDTPERGDWLD